MTSVQIRPMWVMARLLLRHYECRPAYVLEGWGCQTSGCNFTAGWYYPHWMDWVDQKGVKAADVADSRGWTPSLPGWRCWSRDRTLMYLSSCCAGDGHGLLSAVVVTCLGVDSPGDQQQVGCMWSPTHTVLRKHTQNQMFNSCRTGLLTSGWHRPGWHSVEPPPVWSCGSSPSWQRCQLHR